MNQQLDPALASQANIVVGVERSLPPQQSPSSKFKTIVTILALIFFTPVGIALMLFWSGWSTKAKVVAIVIPIVVIPILATILAILVTSVGRVQKCRQGCLYSIDRQLCVDRCLENLKK